MDSEASVSARLSPLIVAQAREEGGSIFRLSLSHRRVFDCFVRRHVLSRRDPCRGLRVWWSLLLFPCRLPLRVGRAVHRPGLVGHLVCKRSTCLATARST